MHIKWKQYRLLYAGEESVQLLNRTAPTFFRILRDVLWEDIVLHIARLWDLPESNGKATLSLRGLRGRIQDRTLAKSLRLPLKGAETASAFAVDWRNRKLAHRDLALAMGAATTPLAPASREKVSRALAAISRVLNVVEAAYSNGGEVAYDHFTSGGDAKALLHRLSMALRAEETWKAELLRRRSQARI